MHVMYAIVNVYVTDCNDATVMSSQYVKQQQ